jgi:propanol-preferring alcohol dehydrogenase
MKMKAWILNTPAPVNELPLAHAEMPVPTPSEDELLLRVHACGICRTDSHVVEGELPVRRSPLIPGHQIVGRVAALGSRAEGFAIGDRVGLAWLNRTCGVCEFCLAGQENLCEQAMFT